MFRDQWREIEETLQEKASEIRSQFLKAFESSKSQVKQYTDLSDEERKQKFEEWGKTYVEKVKSKANNQKLQAAKDNFLVLLRNLGINDELLIESFNANKKEVLDPLIGETIAIIALVLGWSQKDKEAFSQALGEIGVVGVFAAKPFLCLIALCGLAYGYQEHFHKEAFKKGGVLGFAGITAAFFSPGGFVGILATVVTILYFNKKLKVDRPIEAQLKEIVQQIHSGEFFKEVRNSWQSLESFLSKLFEKKPNPPNQPLLTEGQ